MRKNYLIAYMLPVLVIVGCEREAAISGMDEGEPIVFTAKIAGGSSMDVSTRAETAAGNTYEHIPADIVSEMDAARDRLLKRTFITKATSELGRSRDVIRVYNQNDPGELPVFDLGERCFQYVCDRHNDDNGYNDAGSDEEDGWVKGEVNEHSEYVFAPDVVDGREKGFRLADLVDDNSSYFAFYAAWWRTYSPSFAGVSPTEVERDQSTEDALLNSDMLLARTRHLLIGFEQPIRFVFYHAFAMLDVRVTLPVYNEGHRVTGEEDKEGEVLPSGYRMDEVDMYMTNFRTKFSINPNTSTNTGDKPDVSEDRSVDPVGEIKMYRYYTESSDKPYTNPDAGHPDTGLDGEGVVENSRYRTYGFCGIVPSTTFPNATIDYPILRLKVKDPLTGNPQSLVYIPRVSEDAGVTPLSGVNSGYISIVEFGVSRVSGRMLVLSAQVQPWDPAYADVDVQREQ